MTGAGRSGAAIEERDAARGDTRLQARFLSYRLNQTWAARHYSPGAGAGSTTRPGHVRARTRDAEPEAETR